MAVALGRALRTAAVGVEDVARFRTAVEQLGQAAVAARKPQSMILTRRFLREARQRPPQSKVADSSGADLTAARCCCARWPCGACWLAKCCKRREVRRRFVAAVVGGVVVNAALALDRRVAVNLNYRHVRRDERLHPASRNPPLLTSRRVMEKFDFQIEAELV